MDSRRCKRIHRDWKLGLACAHASDLAAQHAEDKQAALLAEVHELAGHAPPCLAEVLMRMYYDHK